ncbi:MAG: hypothetical protein EOO27_28895 [Comamonadaceae bacterium]|nr:MAG: hypothetical protein EOO27_28895 [Comamonadaceae bacterium]
MIFRSDPLNTPSSWTLADVLSSFRYWAFVLAVLLAACAMRGVMSSLPLIASQTGASYAQLSVVSIGASAGWLVGGMLAFLVMPRWPRVALGLPVAGMVIANATVLALPQAWSAVPYLALQGVCIGAFAVVPVVFIASLLVSGRMSKTDFIHAFALPVLLVGTLPEFSSFAAAMVAESESPLQVLAAALFGCTFCALILLLLTRPLNVGEEAPRRHAPIPYRLRSPLKIALIGFVPALLALAHVGMGYVVAAQGVTMPESIGLILSIVGGLLALWAVLYVLYWLYRVHGEAASQAPSQRLLTPVAAVAISVLVPLGVFLVLITLGRVLRDRQQDLPGRAAFPLRWMAFWSVIAPPIAMALIQRGINGLHAGGVIPTRGHRPL